MYAKAQKKKEKNFALTIIYLVVITAKERKSRLSHSLFFFSLSASVFFYLQAREAITTNRNIGTATAYNTIHTYIERPLAIFFSPCVSLWFVRSTRMRFESSGVCIALHIVRTHPQAVISCHFITFIIILPKIPGR